MASAANILQRQFKELTRNPVPGFVVDLKDDNIFEWDVALIGSPKTMYEGGYFKATMTFPDDYPFNPPTFKFNNEFYHPNVYPDGRLCISILHPPGEDPISGEKAEERWNPTQSVESVLVSIISLLADPNCSSPANVDAGVAYRKNRDMFESVVKKQVEASKKDIPNGFKMPTSEQDFMPTAPPEIEEDDNL
ncbi:Ubiquitin-conjugating enzyme E2 [Choanephora cucurbitarum]|uniref:Ubiquitin-conjugating enzyme E2 n=1 Tax=Choanephora cucurbitarum TaxID=101091 RepID=A0A1C7NP75_9FUNG|nr:Ubiquitin-conjugating enzyme E2 [Choanephora cucurbitarum]